MSDQGEEAMQAQPAVVEGGSSDDSDSEFEEIEASAEDMELITNLEAELSANPNLYDKHVEVPRLLSRLVSIYTL